MACIKPEDWTGLPGSLWLDPHPHRQSPTLCLLQKGLGSIYASGMQGGFPSPGTDGDRQEKAKICLHDPDQPLAVTAA